MLSLDQLPGLIVSAVGWLVVYRLNLRNTIRVRQASQIDRLVSQIEAIEVDATSYYLKGVEEKICEELALQIKRKLKAVSASIAVVEEGSKSDLGLGDQLLDFRQAVTDGNFESKERDPGLKDERVYRFTNAASVLKASLERHSLSL